ncbi:anaphase-promoting complex subunit 7 [Adelges cooleyi]|uniref:anaphase-promoting complex subunit 7 n=1 Tax=Adelges cooleyi TaxID=133065 RepID=UPI002180163E|nr:anaphase-promoting complex subunit 7 [Adelges cooleyi]
MNALFEQIKVLHSQKLYSNITKVGEMIIKVTEHTTDVLMTHHKFRLYAYLGDSHYNMGNYRHAVIAYKAALTFKEACSAVKTPIKQQFDNLREPMPDIDIKYQLHLCLIKLKDFQQALTILQSVPTKQRKTKINMALGKLHQQLGNVCSAISAYNKVLKECPLAIEAAEGLLSLGVKGTEVNALMLEMVSINGLEWLSGWIRAHAHLYNHTEYPLAINTLKQLDDHTSLSNSNRLLVAIGRAYYYIGDRKNALIYLQRAHKSLPIMQDGLSTLAMCLYMEKQNRELEKLLPTTYTDEALLDPQLWVVFAFICYSNSNHSKAICLVEKACSFDPKNIETLLLHGMILTSMKKYTDAILQFRRANDIAPNLFDPHKGMVDCYISLHKMRSALTAASNCCKQMNNHPKALTLYASVLIKDQISFGKAKIVLEKALNVDEYYLPAVYMLAQIFEQEGNLNAAVALLHKQALDQPTCRLYQMLGDFSVKQNQTEKAFDYYYSALNLDPNNKRVMESLENMGKPCNTSTATSTDSAGPVLNGSLLDATFSGVNNVENESTPFNAGREEDTFMDSDHEGSGSDISI